MPSSSHLLMTIWGILFVYYYTQNCYEHLCTSLRMCSVASVVSRFMRPTPDPGIEPRSPVAPALAGEFFSTINKCF